MKNGGSGLSAWMAGKQVVQYNNIACETLGLVMLRARGFGVCL